MIIATVFQQDQLNAIKAHHSMRLDSSCWKVSLQLPLSLSTIRVAKTLMIIATVSQLDQPNAIRAHHNMRPDLSCWKIPPTSLRILHQLSHHRQKPCFKSQ